MGEPRLDTSVEGNMRGRARIHPIFVLSGALFLLIACGPVATPSLMPQTSLAPSAPDRGSPQASADLGGTATPVAQSSGAPPTSAPPTETPEPSTSPEPTQHVELISSDGPKGYELVGFDGGYLTYGFKSVFFSADGVAWRRINLPVPESRCTDGGYEYNAGVATNGAAINVVVGVVDDSCEGVESFASLSTDGRNWRSSDAFGTPYYQSEATVVDVWPVPDGWEVAIGNVAAHEGTEIWWSADGLSWEQRAIVEGTEGWNIDGDADWQGRRILSAIASGSSGPFYAQQIVLVTSVDGRTWSDLEGPVSSDGSELAVSGLFPPTEPDDRWVITMDEFSETSPEPYLGWSAWRSNDLQEWREVSRHGSWRPRLPHLDGSVIGTAAGPAGVIAVVSDGQVYRLVP